MNTMSENTRDDGCALGGVVLKVFVEPAMGVNRTGDEVPCRHGQNKYRTEILRHAGKAGKRENLAQILRAADKAETAAIGDFFATPLLVQWEMRHSRGDGRVARRHKKETGHE